MLSRRLLIALSGMLALTSAGTLGYVVLEEAPLLDALYMTVVTLSTVGYREVVPLSSGGRAFTIALIVTGVTFALYSISVLGETLLAGTLPARRAGRLDLSALARYE